MDLRILKTHKAIRNAFIHLLSEQDYDDITIQTILDKALVNRATFYKYYNGKSDLAGQMIDDFKQQLNQLLLDRLNAEPNTLKIIMESHSENMFDMRQQMLALLKIRTKRHNLYHDIFEMMKHNFIELAKRHATTHQISLPNLDYQSTMAATMFMTSMQYYFQQDLPIPMNIFEDWQQMIDIIKI